MRSCAIAGVLAYEPLLVCPEWTKCILHHIQHWIYIVNHQIYLLGYLTLGFETDQSLYDVCSDRLVGVKVITKNNENNNAFNVKIIIT